MISKSKGDDFFIYQFLLSLTLLFSPLIIIYRIVINKEDKFRVKEKFCFFPKKEPMESLFGFMVPVLVR